MSGILRCVGLLSVCLLTQGQGSVATRTAAPLSAEAVLQMRELAVGADVQRTESGGLTVGSRVVAKGVEIRIGAAVLVADEAEIRRGAPGEASDIELRGNVHLKAIVEVKYAGESK